MKRTITRLGVAVAVFGLVGSAGSFALAADMAPSYKQTFTTALTGAEQVPAVSTSASGSAVFKVTEDEQKIDFSVTVNDAQDLQAGHIHCGAKGQNGPVIADLFMTPIASANGEIAKGSLTNESVKAAGATCNPSITNIPQLVQAMREGLLYVNIHTAQYPNGLIRGQIGNAATVTPTQPVMSPTTTQPMLPYVAASNPDGVANDALVGISRNLETAMKKFASFNGLVSIQSVLLDAAGTAYVTYDAAGGKGGVLKVANVATSTSYQIVAGADSGLVAPKGIELVPSKQSYVVADNGAKTIAVFKNGVSSPSFVVSNLGGVSTRSVWDSSYDAATDTLYVASTDGLVLVYDDLFVDKGMYGPTRLIVPTNDAGMKMTVNLHGIAFDSARNALVLSDVGSATVATDGQLMTLSNVRQASGKQAVDAHIAGPLSKLGNPVDLLYDGQHLLVAEKANDRVLQFNDIFARRGHSDLAPTYQVQVLKPESITQ